MTHVPLPPPPSAADSPVIDRGMFPLGEAGIMHSVGGAIARLLVMGAVMGVVLVGSVVAGLAATTAIAMGIVGAGLV